MSPSLTFKRFRFSHVLAVPVRQERTTNGPQVTLLLPTVGNLQFISDVKVNHAPECHPSAYVYLKVFDKLHPLFPSEIP
jgi:hypothetical protein